MDTMNLVGTDDTPNVILDAANSKFELSGRSLPEDVAAFYKPILSWMEAFAETVPDKITFDFKLNYFSTASSKMILDILLKLEEMNEDNDKVTIRWHYPSNDEDMKEAGEEYADMVEVPFEMIEY